MGLRGKDERPANGKAKDLPAQPKSASPVVTEDALVRALRQPTSGPGDAGLTVAELIETTGYGQMKVRKLLKSYVKAGRLIVGTAPRTGIHGKASIVPVYRIEE